MQPHRDIEIVVLAGVDHVEAGHPQRHGRTEYQGGQAISARNTTQAADGASARAIPSQTWASRVNRLA